MRIRYSGDAEAKNLAVPGGLIECPRMEWVDVEAEAERLGIPVEHAQIAARGVVKQDEWQLEGAVKAARTRKKAAKKASKSDADDPTLAGRFSDQGPELVVLPEGTEISNTDVQSDDTPSGEEA